MISQIRMCLCEQTLDSEQTSEQNYDSKILSALSNG